MSKRRLRVGFIGAGARARGALLEGWQKIKEAEVVGVADISRPAAEAFAARAGGIACHTDPRELLGQGLDAVVVSTPSALHTEMVLASLAAGCHVLCEKPLATSTQDIRRIGEAVTHSGRLLMTAQHFRFEPKLLAAKRWAETGALGTVYHSKVQALRRAQLPPRPSFLDPKTSGGGPCMDIGVHMLDAALWMLGFPRPVRVTGTTRTNFAKGHTIPGLWGEWDREKFAVEDFAAGFVTFEDGTTLTLECSWLGHQESIQERMHWELMGTGASLEWPELRFATTRNRVFEQGTIAPALKGTPAHEAEVRAFADCVLEGTPSLVPWQESLKVIAILEAIYRSAREGCEVEIPKELFPQETIGLPRIEAFEEAHRSAA